MQSRLGLNHLVVFMAILLVVFMVGRWSVSNPTEISSTNYQWGFKMEKSFSDEPSIVGKPLGGWIVPSDPDVIKPITFGGAIEDLLGGVHSTDLTVDELKDIWTESDIERLENFIAENNLMQSYYDYFYASARIPTSMITADVTGEDVDEEIFVSYGVGCVSCHPVFIDIIMDSIQFETVVNKGVITTREDGKGFYLENQYTGDEYATCCADNVVISRYEWNGKGFTEVARKQVSY